MRDKKWKLWRKLDNKQVWEGILEVIAQNPMGIRIQNLEWQYIPWFWAQKSWMINFVKYKWFAMV